MFFTEKVDHPHQGFAGAGHQVGTDTGGDFVAGAVEMAGDGLGGGEAWALQTGVLDELQSRLDFHLAFDGRAADLAVTLGGVGIADREQSAFDFDGQIERDAGSEVADVHVAADAAWRHDGVQAGFGGRQADRASKRFQRHGRRGRKAPAPCCSRHRTRYAAPGL